LEKAVEPKDVDEKYVSPSEGSQPADISVGGHKYNKGVDVGTQTVADRGSTAVVEDPRQGGHPGKNGTNQFHSSSSSSSHHLSHMVVDSVSPGSKMVEPGATDLEFSSTPMIVDPVSPGSKMIEPGATDLEFSAAPKVRVRRFGRSQVTFSEEGLRSATLNSPRSPAIPHSAQSSKVKIADSRNHGVSESRDVHTVSLTSSSSSNLPPSSSCSSSVRDAGKKEDERGGRKRRAKVKTTLKQRMHAVDGNGTNCSDVPWELLPDMVRAQDTEPFREMGWAPGDVIAYAEQFLEDKRAQCTKDEWIAKGSPNRRQIIELMLEQFLTYTPEKLSELKVQTRQRMFLESHLKLPDLTIGNVDTC
jgi:hypothetical protein